jgi:hypothetical protein
LQLIGAVVSSGERRRRVGVIEVGRATAAIGPGRGQLNDAFSDLHELAFEFDPVTLGEAEVGHDLRVGELEDVHFEDQFCVPLVLRNDGDLERHSAIDDDHVLPTAALT